MERPSSRQIMKPHSYTPIADLVVELTDTSGKQHLFLVSSANLRVASPVWRKTLDPDSKFAPLKTVSIGGKEYRKITVDGVQVDALRIILGIIHYDTRDIPTHLQERKISYISLNLTFSVLRDIALLVDQYDCASITLPWADRWVGDGRDRVEWLLAPDYTRVACEDWIFIASVFSRLQTTNCDAIIKLVSKELIKSIIVGTDGLQDNAKFYRWKERLRGTPDPAPIEMRTQGEKTLELVEVNLDLVPEKFLGFILQKRTDLSRRILFPLYDFVQEFLNSGPTCEGTRLCKNRECSAIALGTLIQSLKEQGFQHLLTKDLIGDQRLLPGRYSLADLASRVRGVQMTTFQLRNIHTAMAPDDFDSILKNGPVIWEYVPAGIERQLVPYQELPIFLRNEKDFHRAMHSSYSTLCPLAVSLAEIKKEAQDVFETVKGYEVME
ncbi:hypothetical protein TWF281_001661 [Arthrobotrys megalospora]